MIYGKDGLKKVFEDGGWYWSETYYSNFAQPSREEAEKVLEKIREAHPDWEEYPHGYGVEQDPKSKLWRAWRRHRKPI